MERNEGNGDYKVECFGGLIMTYSNWLLDLWEISGHIDEDTYKMIQILAMSKDDF